MKYSKQPLDYSEILDLLESRGLIIRDRNKAIECLKVVSYFRLDNYFHPMESDKVQHIFKPGSTFDNAMDLYRFDCDLRELIFTAIQAVEIALRSKMIHHISLQYGAFWFTDVSLFRDANIHHKCMEQIRQELKRTREEFIIEHSAKYSEPEFPPVWKTLEVTSFGTLSKLSCNFADNKIKKRIAREFNLPQHLVLESWIKSAVVLRNYLAHHSRVWNRKFPIKPQMTTPLRGNWVIPPVGNYDKLYSQLCYLQYLLNVIRPCNNFSFRLKVLLTEHLNVDTSAMGFPGNWLDEPLWR
ncbi:Abi family protein [Leyella stercorea]|uniref:Abi family protein n=1 Tax=Leyella stercorea TaxID=363265 RepID=UPI00248AF20A|nr:Abi family protein [Leyella stercorea]